MGSRTAEQALAAGLGALALAAVAGSCGTLRELAPAPLTLPGPPIGEEEARPWFRTETYALDNGLTVVLLEDHDAPQVVVDVHLPVGWRDEAAGEQGLARLAAHSLLLGDPHVDARRAVDLERAASESASTGPDSTQYVAVGPPDLLEPLLARAAGRLVVDDALATPELARFLDAELTDTYGATDELLESLVLGALHREDHPYHPRPPRSSQAPRISPAELLRFRRTFHGPTDATLVVAGDLDPAAARAWIADSFAPLARRRAPVRHAPTSSARAHAERIEVAGARDCELVLAWPSPAAFAPGDAELELLASILSEGPGSRLERRIVFDRPLAEEVEASQVAAELGSVFRVRVRAAPGADLDAIARAVQDEIDTLAREGPHPDERLRAAQLAESRFRQRMEGLIARAEAVQAYRRAYGVADAFERDLARRTQPTVDDLRATARTVLCVPPVELYTRPATPASVRSERLDAREAPAAGSAELRGSS